MTTGNQVTNDSATLKDHFELLYRTVEGYNERFVSSVMRVAGVLLVMIGWLLTSNSANLFFKSSAFGAIGVLIVLAVLIAVYWYSILRVFNINHKAYQQLRELCYIEECYYAHHQLPLSYKYIGIGLNVCNYVIVGILVWNARWPFM